MASYSDVRKGQRPPLWQWDWPALAEEKPMGLGLSAAITSRAKQHHETDRMARIEANFQDLGLWTWHFAICWQNKGWMNQDCSKKCATKIGWYVWFNWISLVFNSYDIANLQPWSHGLLQGWDYKVIWCNLIGPAHRVWVSEPARCARSKRFLWATGCGFICGEFLVMPCSSAHEKNNRSYTTSQSFLAGRY